MEIPSIEDIISKSTKPSTIDILIEDIVKLKQVTHGVKERLSKEADNPELKMQQDEMLVQRWTQETQLHKISPEEVSNDNHGTYLPS